MVQNYLNRTGREEWAREVDTLFIFSMLTSVYFCLIGFFKLNLWQEKLYDMFSECHLWSKRKYKLGVCLIMLHDSSVTFLLRY